LLFAAITANFSLQTFFMIRIFLVVCCCWFLTACKSTEPVLVKKPAVPLTNTYWKLAQLNGVAVENNSADEIYIQLTKENSFKGFAGCNLIWGFYKLNEPQLRFTNINRTKTMCTKYTSENQLIKVLENSEAYIINDTHLQLLKLDGTIVAIFDSSILTDKK